jgi:hypothetical protein
VSIPHPALETSDRPRCPHCNRLLERNTGKCWSCKKTPQEWEDTVHVVNTNPIVEGETDQNGWVLTTQPTLDDLLFDRYHVETVKVTVSGAFEIPLEALRQFDAGLEPGADIVCSFKGHVADVSSPWTVKDGHRGRLALKAEVLNGLHVMEADHGD